MNTEFLGDLELDFLNDDDFIYTPSKFKFFTFYKHFISELFKFLINYGYQSIVQHKQQPKQFNPTD